MGEKKVRRLPVVNASNKLQGILSMDDVVLHADAKNPELSYEDVVKTLKGLYSPPLPELAQQRAPGLDAKEDALAVVDSGCFIEGGQ